MRLGSVHLYSIWLESPSKRLTTIYPLKKLLSGPRNYACGLACLYKAFIWRVQTGNLQPSTPSKNCWDVPTLCRWVVSMFVGHSFGESKQVPYNHHLIE